MEKKNTRHPVKTRLKHPADVAYLNREKNTYAREVLSKRLFQ